MNQETLQALQDSIAHHERARDNRESENVGSETCPLCRLFLKRNTGGAAWNCDGCPVKERTGKNFCQGSPWYPDEDWSEELCDVQFSERVSDDKWRELEQREIDFLRSLLPMEAATPATPVPAPTLTAAELVEGD
jgi:hypothetical protein